MEKQKNQAPATNNRPGQLPLAHQKLTDTHMKKNEEYVENKGRDWLVFLVSAVLTLVILWVKPEWVWVGFPFVFTSLAGAMGRL
jgi:hypothetical protein